MVQNYTLGQPLTNSNLVSFSYTSNLLPSFNITGGGTSLLSGTLPAVLPGPSSVDVIISNTNQAGGPTFLGFIANTSGTWCVGAGTTCNSDQGTAGTWSAAAAPAPTPSAPAGVPALSTSALISLALMFALAGWILLKRAVKSTAR